MDVAGLKREVEHVEIPFGGFCPCKASTSAERSCKTIPLEVPERIKTIRQSLEKVQGPMDQRSQKKEQVRRTMSTRMKKQGVQTRLQTPGFCRWLEHKRCVQRKTEVLLKLQSFLRLTLGLL